MEQWDFERQIEDIDTIIRDFNLRRKALESGDKNDAQKYYQEVVENFKADMEVYKNSKRIFKTKDMCN